MADGFTTTRSVPMPVRWGEKRYHSLDYALKSQFGEKVYRIALNGGMTCPNRKSGSSGETTGSFLYCLFPGIYKYVCTCRIPGKDFYRGNP